MLSKLLPSQWPLFLDRDTEQLVHDQAVERRENRRKRLASSKGEATGDEVAARALRKRTEEELAKMQPPDAEAFFGWVSDGEQRTYVGRDVIVDEDEDVLVVGWWAPAAARYYAATADDPAGAIALRRFAIAELQINEMFDFRFDAPGDVDRDDEFLRELGGGLRIVDRIHAEQWKIIGAPVNRSIVVQGGPGTGKTAVALHRISYLLRTASDSGEDLSARDVVFVGPSKVFISYVGSVLPSLGEVVGPGGVRQTTVGGLRGGVEAPGVDGERATALKGEERIMGLLDRAIQGWARSGLRGRSTTIEAEATWRVGGTRLVVRVPLQRSLGVIDDAVASGIGGGSRRIGPMEAGDPYEVARRTLRTALTDHCRSAIACAHTGDTDERADAERRYGKTFVTRIRGEHLEKLVKDVLASEPAAEERSAVVGVDADASGATARKSELIAASRPELGEAAEAFAGAVEGLHGQERTRQLEAAAAASKELGFVVHTSAIEEAVNAAFPVFLKTSGGAEVPGVLAAVVDAHERIGCEPFGLRRDSLRTALNNLCASAESETGEGGTARLDPRVSAAIGRLVDRVLPSWAPEQFLRDLLASRSRLRECAGNDFSDEEIEVLHRPRGDARATPSPGDLPLIDYLEWRLNGPPRERAKFVFIDEAQDLSPMALRMIGNHSLPGRRAVLGDLAQSTGPFSRDSWSDVVEALCGADGAGPEPVSDFDVLTLQIGYRVPGPVLEFAAQLLPLAAPGLAPPTPARAGAAPRFVESDGPVSPDLLAAEIMYLRGDGLGVGVIAPEAERRALGALLDERGIDWGDGSLSLSHEVVVIDPVSAKGLEFDAVIVVEPAAIAESDLRGERLLYIALTRCTRVLSVVHSRPYPLLGIGTVLAEAGDGPVAGADLAIDGAAEAIAGSIRSTVLPDRWSELLRAVASRLGLDSRR